MGVIRPAHSPHPGSHAMVEGANAQKDRFASMNLESVGMVSNTVTGFGRAAKMARIQSMAPSLQGAIQAMLTQALHDTLCSLK
jgi:hypothetical protein